MLRYLAVLWRNLLHREQVDREVDEEIGAYLELAVAEKMRRGIPQEQARRDARRELGSLDGVKENVRDIRIGAFVDTLVRDFRYALRTLAGNPGFSAVAILTLALGIGANTTIFTVVNGVLLKPLPYPEPDRVLMLWEKPLAGRELSTVSPSNFFDWREQSHSFSHMAAIDAYPDFIMNGFREPKRLSGAAVSSGFLPLFGVRMALGRDFTREEDQPGRNHVVILSNQAWTRYFGARSDMVGRSVTLNDDTYTVIGVLPSDFSLVSKASDFQARNQFDLFTPLALGSPPEAWMRGTHPLCVFARLKPGATLAAAQADLDRIAAILQRLYPESNKQMGIAAVPLDQYVVANVRTALFTLLAAVGMVFLIACANIANLLLTRAAARQREMSLRAALGASRGRLARQLLTESLVLAGTGGALGAAAAVLGVPALVRWLPSDLPRTSEIAVDGSVLAFTTLIALTTGVVFGLVPLYQTWRANANDALKQSGRGMTAGQSWLRSALIVGQVAIAMVLLNGAGLMARSFQSLLQVAPGFQTEQILTARLSLPPRYTKGDAFGTGHHRQLSAFEKQLTERLHRIPGVRSAALTAYLPLGGTTNHWGFDIEGRPPKPAGVYHTAHYRPVSAGYFETVGIPIERGRGFDSSDTEDRPPVVAINHSMARAFWARENPVGQRVRFGGDASWRTVIGVVGDVHHDALNSTPEPELYLPYAQVPNIEARPTVVLRTSVEPTAVVSDLRLAVGEVGPGVAVDHVKTMKQIVFGSVQQSRFRTGVLVVFAVLALMVASIGLYGVMAYLVSQRIREFGIRMAIGASRGAVLRLVLRQAARLVGIGLGMGLVAATLLARLIATLLFGVTPFDAVTLAAVAILLAVVALVASYLPAHRAASVDPMQTLRYE